MLIYGEYFKSQSLLTIIMANLIEFFFLIVQLIADNEFFLLRILL